jgi:hypothetical protein
VATPREFRRRGRWSLIAGTMIAAALMATAASADDISNNLDASIDSTAEIMPLNVGGANGTTQLYVTPRNEDGKNGCNLTGSATLGLSLASSDPSVATVSPSSVTFGNCGETKTLTVTPVGPGSATISATQLSNTTSGTFNLAPVAFTVNVAPPANTAPVVTVSGVTAGASYSKGEVPAATCQVTDAENGDSSFPASLSAVSGPYAVDGIGEQTASCSYTDAGGLTASGSMTYAIVDPSAPSIGYTLAPATPDGLNGWFTSDVSLSWNVSELESPISLQKSGCDDQSVTADQVETSYSCAASSAGGSAGPMSVSIKRDATKPTINGSSSPAPNAVGWNNTDVSVSFVCADNLSGVASCDPDQTLATEGAGQSATGAAVDNAGNSDTATVSGINIDKTPPAISWSGGPSDGASYYFGAVPAPPTCEANDSLSGVDGCSVSGYSSAVGTHTLTATADDVAGNQTVEQRTYTVLAWTLRGFYKPTDMSGVLNTVKNGATVPLKFQVFAGASELTSTSYVQGLSAKKISCDTSAPTDDIEVTATGGTTLRYDTTSSQFIYNWQTPKTAGACYAVTATTNDGSSLTASFKLK